jgi:hypothetical protein
MGFFQTLEIHDREHQRVDGRARGVRRRRQRSRPRFWATKPDPKAPSSRRSDAGPVPESIAAVAAAEAAQLVGWSRAPSTATRPPPIARLRTSDRIVENGGASPSRRCGWCQHRYQ